MLKRQKKKLRNRREDIVTTLRSYKIKEGLFFPEDFRKMAKGTIIYIKSGLLINPKKHGGRAK
jgi:hypothetical protein